MVSFKHVPIIKALIPYALGSLIGLKGQLVWEPSMMLLLATTVCLASFLLYWLSRSIKRHPVSCFSLFMPLLFIMAGIGMGQVDSPVNPGLPEREHLVLRGKVCEEPVLRYGRLVFGLELRMAFSEDSVYYKRSLIKVYLDTGDIDTIPQGGELWDFCGRLYLIKNSGNPGEVDYASILKRKNCWYRFYCSPDPDLSRKLGQSSGWIPDPAEIRKILSANWKGPDESIALLRAVCLGDRGSLSEDLRQSYSLAGGMHVLAVSGLHVGLIWWVLNHVFSFVAFLRKREIYRALLITLLLWIYAYTSGFSSSVSRSVTMFTFYALSRIRMQRGHSVNAILISMFMLTLIHPGRFLDVGFQLSYAAILSIVMLHPVLMRIWKPENSIFSWCWEASTLSLAAQIGTLPLLVFYFHQVPVYALVTNLFAVPLLSVIIGIFVTTAPMAISGFGWEYVNFLLVKTGGCLNLLMELIASFPGAVVREIHLDPYSAVVLLLLVFLLILFLNNKSRLSLYFSIVIICFQVAAQSVFNHKCQHSAEVRISHFRRGSLITIREGYMVDHYILSDDPETVATMDRYLSTAWVDRRYELSVIHIDRDPEGRVILGGGSCIMEAGPGIWLVGNSRSCGLVLESIPEESEFEHLSVLKADFILLSFEPFHGGTPLLASFENLVLDGSNRPWYSAELKKAGLTFFDTARQGAFFRPY